MLFAQCCGDEPRDTCRSMGWRRSFRGNGHQGVQHGLSPVGKLLSFGEPLFPHLENGNHMSPRALVGIEKNVHKASSMQ